MYWYFKQEHDMQNVGKLKYTLYLSILNIDLNDKFKWDTYKFRNMQMFLAICRKCTSILCELKCDTYLCEI